MVGWGLGEKPDLLFDNGDSDNDLNSEDQGGIVGFLELVNAICFKPENEGFPVFLSVALTSEAKIKDEKETSNVKKSNDKEDFEMVIKRMTDKVRVAALLRIRWRTKLTRPTETAGVSWKVVRAVSSVVEELRLLVKDKKSMWQNSCKDRVQKRTRSFCHGKKNWQVKENLMKEPGP